MCIYTKQIQTKTTAQTLRVRGQHLCLRAALASFSQSWAAVIRSLILLETTPTTPLCCMPAACFKSLFRLSMVSTSSLSLASVSITHLDCCTACEEGGQTHTMESCVCMYMHVMFYHHVHIYSCRTQCHTSFTLSSVTSTLHMHSTCTHLLHSMQWAEPYSPL